MFRKCQRKCVIRQKICSHSLDSRIKITEGVDETSSWKDYFKAVALQNTTLQTYPAT